MQVVVPWPDAGQILPQAPQLATSESVFRQPPLHGCRGETQEKPHMEAAQVATAPAGAGQTLPQVPQSCGSVFKSTQPPLQGVRPAPQDAEHPLTVQSCEVLHVVVQLPQWSESAARLTQAPLQS